MDVTQLKPLVLSDLKPPLNITLVTPETGLEALSSFVAEKLRTKSPIGFDTETNVCSDFYFRKVRTIQVGDKAQQFVIDLLPFAGTPENLSNTQGKYTLAPCYKPIFDILTPVLCEDTVLKVGQNLGFEYTVMRWNFGLRTFHFYSTDLAERVIQAGRISLKKMAEFSMQSIVARRFGLIVDKEQQDKFDLEKTLTKEMIEYAAFDTRMPFSIMESQLREATKDQLLTTIQIENDAIGAYGDMHLNGLKLDGERWMKRIDAVVERRKEELKVLDTEFIKLVGRKTEQIDFEELNGLEQIWRTGFEEATPEEMQKAEEVRETRDAVKKAALRVELKSLKDARLALKKEARTKFSELSKKATVVKNSLPKCEGEAYINYGSNDQLLAVLKRIRGMSTLASAGDEHLLKYNDRPFVQTLRKYRKGKKDTGTYGVQWTQTWITKASKEEGWVHPWDGRIHAVWNQLEAETGRSSSQKPSVMNLPKEDEVRACFIASPPEELLRISTCCNDYAEYAGHNLDDQGNMTGPDYGRCSKCGQIVPTVAEEYVIVTCDMSGAELRIIAEMAHATSWINAFAKGWDVHSVSTEILEPEKWAAGGLPDCAYFALDTAGEPKRQKCSCPIHKELRDATKAVNFLLCYGGGPDALADDLGITVDAAKELMKKHEAAFPDVWGFLRRAGLLAQEKNEARDLYGRRRLLPPPTWESSREWFIDEHADRLKLPEDVQKRNLFNFKAQYLRSPNELEKHQLTHRAPNDYEIKSAMRGLYGSIGRKGKNHPIQGTNASLAKRVMSWGRDAQGKGYLWHLLPEYNAKLLSFIHDEFVIECPKRLGQAVLDCVIDAIRRAGAEVLKSVVMEAEGNIGSRWQK